MQTVLQNQLDPSAPPRAVLLYRASTKKQTDTDNDIPLQRNMLVPWAERQGWQIIDQFCEGGVSGFKVSADNRDALVKIKAMAERREFDVLGLYMSDRLGRLASETPLVVAFLNRMGVRVMSFSEGEIANQSHNDSLTCFIKFWQAEGESRKTQRRVQDATLDCVKRGVWRGGNPPYGYKMVSRGRLNGKGKPIRDIDIDPEEAEVVKTIFRLYAVEHYGSYGIAKYLNDRGITRAKGGPWMGQKILKLLRDKMYLGHYELYKQDKTKDSVLSLVMEHMVIIDQKTFDEAQKRLRESGEKYAKGRRPTQFGSLIFNGMVFCTECGRKFTTHRYSYETLDADGKPQRNNYCKYRCNSFRIPSRKKSTCTSSQYKADDIEEQVVMLSKKFIRQVDKDQILATHKNDIQVRLETVQSLLQKEERELAKKDKEIAKLKDEIMKSLMGEGTFAPDIIQGMLATKEGERAGYGCKDRAADHP